MIKIRPMNGSMQNDYFKYKKNINEEHKTTYMY